MIVKTIDLQGRVKYFQTATGREVKLQREVGRHLGRIPDEYFRFLSGVVKVERKTGLGQSEPSKFKVFFHLVPPEKPYKFKVPFRLVPPEKPSWISRLFAWLKSFFDGSK